MTNIWEKKIKCEASISVRWGAESRKGRLHRIKMRWTHILVRKMDRTTYWGYSLSWYNLAGERAKWWDQIKRKGERERKERAERERKKRHFTSFKVHSADNQALLWGHHPGTGSESGSPFPSTRPIIHPSFHTIRPKHRRRQDLHVMFKYAALHY